MSNVTVIAQSLHKLVKSFRCPFQSKILHLARVTESKSGYAGRYDMESLLCSIPKARSRLRVCKRIDDLLDLYK